MTKVRVLPHRVIDEDAVTWGPWRIRDGSTTAVDPELLPAWDYKVELEFESSVALDLTRTLTSAGVDGSSLALVIVADCPAANVRLAASTAIDPLSGSAVARLTVPAGVLAESVRLTKNVVLANGLEDGAAGVARRAGSVLATSERSIVALEGNGGRFPTEAVDFRAVGRPESPWTIVTTFDSIDESFVGSVRLLVNSEHPVGQLTLAADQPAGLDAVMKADIVRRLLLDLSAREVDLSVECPEESVGDVIAGMCDLYLGMSIETAIKTLRADPAQFEDLLASSLDPFRAVWAK